MCLCDFDNTNVEPENNVSKPSQKKFSPPALTIVSFRAKRGHLQHYDDCATAAFLIRIICPVWYKS
jgi:hypothetical protein